MALRFRPDFEQTLLTWIHQERRAVTGLGEPGFEVLSSPEPDSPFLTLAESRDEPRIRPSALLVSGAFPAERPLAAPRRQGLPCTVLKILVVPEDDPAYPFWRETLERERQRWAEELRRRLDPPERVATLGLPLSIPELPDTLVELTEIGPLRGGDLLEEPAGKHDLCFACLLRPFVAWPRLGDLGFTSDQLYERWDVYCAEHGVAERLHKLLFHHFCDEALIGGQSDVLLTSAWRLSDWG